MKKILIMDSDTKNSLKLSRKLKKRFLVEETLEPIDLNYYDFCFISLNILKEDSKSYQNVKNLVCLTNFESKILKEQLEVSYPNVKFLKYDFSDDELYRILNNYSDLEEYKEIIDYLKKDGVISRLKGFVYLVEVINLSLTNNSCLVSIMKAYKEVSIKYQVSTASVERNIRYLIDKYNLAHQTIYKTSDYVYKVVNDFLTNED